MGRVLMSEGRLVSGEDVEASSGSSGKVVVSSYQELIEEFRRRGDL